MRTLTLPPAAQRDPDAIQMLSAWVAEQSLHCTLNVGMWQASGRNELRAWGILLADVVRHIANAHQAEFGRAPEETIAEVFASLERELEGPTSKATGEFKPGHS
jgi:hypothetical protein